MAQRRVLVACADGVCVVNETEGCGHMAQRRVLVAWADGVCVVGSCQLHSRSPCTWSLPKSPTMIMSDATPSWLAPGRLWSDMRPNQSPEPGPIAEAIR